MMDTIIIGNIIGALATIPVAIGMLSKHRESIIKYQVIANTLIFISYILLSAWTAACVSAIAILRCIIFYFREKKSWANTNYWLYLFLGLSIVSVITTWKGFYSVLPALGILIFTVALWVKNTQHIRLLTIASVICWIPYDLITLAFGHLIIKSIELISALTGMVKYKNKLSE